MGRLPPPPPYEADPVASRTVLNENLENEINIIGKKKLLKSKNLTPLHVSGYRLVKWKWLLTSLAMMLTGGLLWLLLYWIPQWKLWFTHEEVGLDRADTILVEDEYKRDYKRYYVVKVKILMHRTPTMSTAEKIPMPKHTGPGFNLVETVRYFSVKKETYLWEATGRFFYPLRGLDFNTPTPHFYEQTGFTEDEQASMRWVYGYNDILVPNHSVAYLLVKEVLNPFYIFQVASVILWTSDEYYYYAAAIVIMSLGGIISSVYQTRENQENLRATIQSTEKVTVKRRDDKFETISSDCLVPGDIIVVPPEGCEMTCDAVLIFGNAIVNESMLTGESVPVTKTVIPRHNRSEVFNDRDHQRHTLFRGTTVVQTRGTSLTSNVLAVVVRTGFLTTKGNLVKSIMFPAPVDFKFEEDSYKFVGFLTMVASIGFGYTCYRLVNKMNK